ncbi:hypothetical protein HY571_02245 [Candidatus Micrarchaeota archaeon]|nr:hypothetical protein [Candidatus Micrarchaeota archaeon]
MLRLEEPLFLDSKGDGTSFVSHAHSDHVVKSAKKILCSSKTFALLKCRKYVKNADHVEKIQGCKSKLLNAGHVFGSSQLLVENGHSFLYTGDIRPSPSLTAGQAEPVACDELLVECTFGLPRYVFPTRIEVGQQVALWAGQNEKRGAISVIGGYSLGKAQEVIAHLNEAGISPLVPKVIADICRVYNFFGCRLDYVEINEANDLLSGAFTAVMPLAKVTPALGFALRQGYGREVGLAHCSGWTVDYSKQGVKGFPLSDHADFNELVEFVEATHAKKVYCVYGFANEFAAFLCNNGINAVSLKEIPKNQRVLTAFTTE